MLQVTERFSEETIKSILMGFFAHIQIETKIGVLRGITASDKVKIQKSSDDDETTYYLLVEGEKMINEIKVICGEVGTYLYVYQCKFVKHPKGGYYKDEEVAQASWYHSQDVVSHYNTFVVM